MARDAHGRRLFLSLCSRIPSGLDAKCYCYAAGDRSRQRQKTKPFVVETSIDDALMQLEQPGTQVDSDAFASLLRRCGKSGSLSGVKRVHEHILRGGYGKSTFLGNTLVQMYGKFRSLADARRVFESLSQRNLFSWNIMIAAYAQNGHVREALELFGQMEREGVVPDEFTAGSMIAMFAKSGSLDDARRMFDRMPSKDVVSWTALINAYAQRGHPKDAVELYRRMDAEGVEPNAVTYSAVLGACSCLGAVAEGKAIHARVVDSGHMSDVAVQSAVINMYGKCKCLDAARRVFDGIERRDVVIWTTMITGYAQRGYLLEALELYREMDVEPNSVTYSSILSACTGLKALAEGKEAHACVVARGLDSELVIQNALVNMYAECGCLDDARLVFDKMQCRNVISWTTVIVAYVQRGHTEEALELYRKMKLEGVQADILTFTSILGACSSEAALSEGKSIHADIVASGYDSREEVQNALVNMYGKCGGLAEAEKLFFRMHQRNVISWTAIVAAYAHHGHGPEALELYQRMELEGVEPNILTFSSILHACSHSGLLDEAWHYFTCMVADCGIAPEAYHFVCMIDLLGRAGRLDDAEELINSSPFEPDVVAWKALLGACRVHGDMKRGGRIAELLIEMFPEDVALYVLTSNMCVGAGKETQNCCRIVRQPHMPILGMQHGPTNFRMRSS